MRPRSGFVCQQPYSRYYWEPVRPNTSSAESSSFYNTQVRAPNLKSNRTDVMEHSALQPSAHLALVELAAGAAGSSSSSFADRPSKVKLDGNKQLFFFFYVRVHIFHVLASCGQKKLCASPSGGFLFLFSGLRRVTSIEIDLQRWVASCIKLFSLTHQPKKIWIFRFLLLSGNFKCLKKSEIHSFVFLRLCLSGPH